MARILDIDTKYKIVIISLIIIFFLVIGLALVGSKVKDLFKDEGPVAIVLNEGDLIINYIDGQDINFFDNKSHEYKITLTNGSVERIYYSLYLNDVNMDGVEVKVKDYSGNVVNTVKTKGESVKLLNLFNLEGEDTVRFTIEIDSDNIINFKGLIKVENESLSPNSFDDLILLNNLIVSPKSRVGNEIATSNEGLISTSDNKGTSYYFRGKVDNNYVRLGQLMFRIVRINGDGTVRLVLNDVLSMEYPYNSKTVADPTQLAILNDSSIINVLNEWADDKLKDYSAYLALGDYCTDSGFTYSFNNINYSRTYERIFVDTAPDLYCSANVYTGKVGLLSIDEVVLAGAYKNMPNKYYYLYNEDIEEGYVTSSSYFINQDNNVSMMDVMADGSIGAGVLTSSNTHIRPVININMEAKVKGEGTVENPYIIVS